ncbi:DUF4112 domain-containing protein [Pedobacter sp. BS3]|uniref:DUF4112 domain-containing protein n=1 Tax=Pedobacter sp. BS3 TaxID=2567937 RepID=UPI0011EEA1FE|nr:DUF4112 domain-containing protein [Pedobacter sp. BS3]TZF82252.1 DUF4112 domain-containing protein [Pedobacter sp. BS3]
MPEHPQHVKLRWVERVSRLMDSQFRLPGTHFRFGLDPLLNLIPVIGDLSGFAVSAALVITMAKYGVSRKVLILMVINVLADALIGVIPFIGQVFDFVYKANDRNIRLLKAHYEEGKHQGSGNGILLLLLILFLVFVFALAFIAWWLVRWLFSLL